MAFTQRNGRARDRAAEMLSMLQLALCGRCGRARYATRRDARHAARIGAPGVRLRAYRCGDAWHLTSPAGAPQFVASPVTLLKHPAVSGRLWLDHRNGDKRPYRRSGLDRRGRPQGAPRRSRRGGTDPLEDDHDHTTRHRMRRPSSHCTKRPAGEVR
ncbi:hypothetical protein GCM10010402_38650 [Actinomadura luteofluorescens]|nr:hypothetical protein [Actinomadura glauciflava]